MNPGKGRRGIPCRESVPPFLQGFSVHPVRTLKRATGRFRPTAESLKAAYRTSPQLCQERTFAIRKENLGICAGALGVGRQDVNGRYRTGSFLSFFPRMFWNDQRGAHGRSVYRFFFLPWACRLFSEPVSAPHSEDVSAGDWGSSLLRSGLPVCSTAL